MCLMACFPPTIVLFWIQELGTVICQLIWSRLSNTSPGLGRVIAGCRHWLEDESRWHIHFKWEQKMNLMLHIIHIWSDTMLTPVPFTKAVYFVWSDVNIVLKRSRRKKSNKIFLHAGSFFIFYKIMSAASMWNDCWIQICGPSKYFLWQPNSIPTVSAQVLSKLCFKSMILLNVFVVLESRSLLRNNVAERTVIFSF